IVSRLPVSSPTAIICATIAGKIGASLSGAAIEPPDLTDSMTDSIAFSTMALPAVWPVTSIACMIGTPAEYSAENVRDQRARAIFWTVWPILNGIRRRRRSHCGRPHEDLRHLRKPTTLPTATAIRMYHWPVTTCEDFTVNLVISGRSPPKSLNTPTKTGTMNAIRPIRTANANVSTTVGYAIADLTWR